VTQKPRIAVIIGSTRDTRFADKPAAWILDLASQRNDWQVELVDLRDFELPLFNEKTSNLWAPSEDPRAVAWQRKLATFDGFIFVTAEYNRSVTGALKNALDQAYNEWVRKPAAVLAYGSTGGARAAEHLRTIAIELQMVPVRSGVHIMGADLIKVHPMGANAPISEIEDHILPSAKAMLADLDWWTRATMSARAGDERAAA
jgi:NAD(P)H-dependent FMN reductase